MRVFACAAAIVLLAQCTVAHDYHDYTTTTSTTTVTTRVRPWRRFITTVRPMILVVPLVRLRVTRGSLWSARVPMTWLLLRMLSTLLLRPCFNQLCVTLLLVCVRIFSHASSSSSLNSGVVRKPFQISARSNTCYFGNLHLGSSSFPFLNLSRVVEHGCAPAFFWAWQAVLSSLFICRFE